MQYCTYLCLCLVTSLICLFVQYSCESIAGGLALAVTLESAQHTELLNLLTVRWESLFDNHFEQPSDYKIKMPNLFSMCITEFFSGYSGYLLRERILHELSQFFGQREREHLIPLVSLPGRDYFPLMSSVLKNLGHNPAATTLGLCSFGISYEKRTTS